MGRVGDSYDNALAESIIGLYKTEVIRQHGPWRHLEAVEFVTLEWVDWFNHRRLPEGIGYVPPAALEQNYYQSVRRVDHGGLTHTKPSPVNPGGSDVSS